MGEELFADIIIDISHEALDKVFQYRVPFSLRGAVTPGVRVCVPFGAGNREREGYVIAAATLFLLLYCERGLTSRSNRKPASAYSAAVPSHCQAHLRSPDTSSDGCSAERPDLTYSL